MDTPVWNETWTRLFGMKHGHACFHGVTSAYLQMEYNTSEVLRHPQPGHGDLDVHDRALHSNVGERGATWIIIGRQRSARPQSSQRTHSLRALESLYGIPLHQPVEFLCMSLQSLYGIPLHQSEVHHDVNHLH
jgi:hypothetical protein